MGNWLEEKFGAAQFFDSSGNPLPQRTKVKLTGSGITPSDDPANEETVLTISGGSAPVASDIKKSDGTTIDTVQGFLGKPLSAALSNRGDVYVYNPTSGKAEPRHPVPPGWFDVTLFGADPTGTAASTTAFNNAFAAAAAAGGGVVFVPPGKYKITARLNDLPYATILRGVSTGGYPLGGPQNSVIESYVADTVLSLGTFTGSNISTFNGVEDLVFVCKNDQDAQFRDAAKTITNVTSNGGKYQITCVGHGYATGDDVKIAGVVGSGGMNTFPNDVNAIWGSITVVDADNFTLDGSTFAGIYTSGGTAARFNQTLFDPLAGCAIEAMGAARWHIRRVSCINYPVGIILDGAECGLIEQCFGGSDSSGGYSDFANQSCGIWMCASDRGRSTFTSDATAQHSIRDCQIGGATNYRCTAAFFTTFSCCNLEGGRRAFDLSGGFHIRVTGCTAEGYTHEVIKLGLVLNCVIDQNFLFSTGVPSIRVTSSPYRVTIAHNHLGGAVGGYSVIGSHFITQLVSYQNDVVDLTVTEIYDSAVPTGQGLVLDQNPDGTRVGLAVNLYKPEAVFHGSIIDTSKPAILIQDANGAPRIVHSVLSQTKQQQKQGLYSTSSGLNDTGPLVTIERALLTFGGGDQVLCSHAPPSFSWFRVEVEVLQNAFGDQTKRARWRFSQTAIVGGAFGTFVVLEGVPFTLEPDESTDGSNFTAPTLATDGASLYVNVHQHASLSSIAVARITLFGVQQ